MSAARARGEGKTPIRSIRAEDDLWTAFSEACETAGVDRSSVIREFLGWYASLPGSQMPRRPSRADAAPGKGNRTPRKPKPADA